MPGYRQDQAEREYNVDHFEGGHDHPPSALADVSILHEQQAPPAPNPAAPGTPAANPALTGNQSMMDLLRAQQEAADPSSATGVCEALDQAKLDQIRERMSTSFTDWAVTDGDARAAVAMLNGVSVEQQGLLIQSLRDSGDLETLVENLPADALENLGPTLGPYMTSARVAEAMDDWVVTDGEAGGALDLVTALPPEQQAASLAELDDATFTEFLGQLPDDRRTDLQAAFEATADPARKLQLWEVLHSGRAQNSHDDNMEDERFRWPWEDPTAEDNAIAHRNQQRDASYAATQAEIAEEVAHLRKRMADGETVTAADIAALDQRKSHELELETEYGVNLTNDAGTTVTNEEGTPGAGTGYTSQRRVWTEEELHQVEGALQRMPTDHVGDNTALTEIRRQDVARRKNDDGTWTERPGVGASAGGGVIRFFDTGTEYDAATGTNGTGNPWRTDRDSPLSGHDPAQHGAGGATHLIQEVLSHELGHTVHQGDSDLESDFHAISGWSRMNADDARARLVADGMTEVEAQAVIDNLEATRSDSYASRNQENSGGDLYMINPYDKNGYLAVDELAIDPNDADWAYAESNPSDHFAEIYTKAIHAPESLYEDLVSGPQADLTTVQGQQVQDRQALQDGIDSGLPEADIQALRDALTATDAAVDRAQRTADIRQEQHEFFQERVFGVNDDHIQALTAPPGKEAVYEEYQSLARMCMTPQQLQALEARYRDRL